MMYFDIRDLDNTRRARERLIGEILKFRLNSQPIKHVVVDEQLLEAMKRLTDWEVFSTFGVGGHLDKLCGIPIIGKIGMGTKATVQELNGAEHILEFA